MTNYEYYQIDMLLPLIYPSTITLLSSMFPLKPILYSYGILHRREGGTSPSSTQHQVKFTTTAFKISSGITPCVVIGDLDLYPQVDFCIVCLYQC